MQPLEVIQETFLHKAKLYINTYALDFFDMQGYDHQCAPGLLWEPRHFCSPPAGQAGDMQPLQDL